MSAKIPASVLLAFSVFYGCRAYYETQDGPAIVHLFGSLIFALLWLVAVTTKEPKL